MSDRKTKSEPSVEGEAEVFDRAHLAHYTLSDEALEREVLGLFLTQLEATIEMIGAAATADEWRLWTHTLKGAAAAVGAWRLRAVALALENTGFDPLLGQPRPSLQAMDEAVAELRLRIASDYPQLAA